MSLSLIVDLAQSPGRKLDSSSARIFPAAPVLEATALAFAATVLLLAFFPMVMTRRGGGVRGLKVRDWKELKRLAESARLKMTAAAEKGVGNFHPLLISLLYR